MAEYKTEKNYLAPFVPNLILDWYSRNGAEQTHTIDTHRGLLCFIDAAGFTHLTGLLGEYGEEGPELLTAILNRYFEILTDEIYARGGDILKFAGDAVWAYFPHVIDLSGLNGAIRKRLSPVNREYEILHEHPLAIHSGAEWGSFFLMSMGRRDIRLEPEPIGEIVQTTLKASELSGPNEFIIGPGLADKVRDKSEIVPCCDGLFKLVMQSSENTSNEYYSKEYIENRSGVSDKAIEPYLAESFLGRVRTSGQKSHLQSEFRRVTVLFANFEFLIKRRDGGNENIFRELNEPVARAFEIIRNAGGNIARIDPFETGHKLMVLFGAPVRRADDELKAVSCASKLNALSNSRFRIRIGLTRGSLFCGEVGSDRRREYTVMGEAINLAARLMSLAEWGEILFNRELREKLPENIVSRERNIRPKGFDHDIPVFRLSGITENGAKAVSGFSLIGRSEELGFLENLWDNASLDSGRTLLIHGEAGIGKSSIVSEFLNNAGGLRIGIECRNSVLFGHAWLARKLVAELYRNSPAAGRTPLLKFIKDRIDSSWWPILAEFVGVSAEDNDWTRGLSPELRLAKAGELFGEIVKSLIKQPTILAIDDFDRADEYSRKIIEPLVGDSGGNPLFLILIQERATIQSDSESFSILNLRAPKAERWREYFKNNFVDGKRERELVEELLNKSAGSPYFITEFIRGAITRKALVPHRLSGKLELAAGTVDPEIPSGAEELQMSRFDLLDEVSRTILKAASAVRGEFPAELIAKALPEIDDYSDRLQELMEYGILNYDPGRAVFSFAHNSMRDTIYACIPKTALRGWHAVFAEYFESSDFQKNGELIGYHFYRAEKWTKAFGYYIDAAEGAVRSHSLNSAYKLFERCREILGEINMDDIDISERYRFFSGHGELLILDGRFNETYAVYRQWRHTGKEYGHTGECLKAAVKTGALMWKQSKYGECRKVMTALLNSPALGSFPAIRAKVLAVTGELERRAGNFGLAEEHCRAAADIAERAGDYQTVADAYNNLGLALWGAGKLEEAAECYRRCLVTAREHYGKYMLAQSSNNLAIVYWEQGDFVSADSMLTEALNVFRNIGDRRNEAYTAGNLSSLHRIAGKFVSARQLLMEADLVFERLDDRHAHHYVAGNIGDLDLIEGSLDSAERYYRMAADFAGEVGDRELAAECAVRFGDLAFFRFELDEAERVYLEAVKKAEEIGSAEYSLRAKIGLARLHIRNRLHEKAAVLITEIKRTAVENNLVIISNEADFLSGEIARIRNNNKEAVEHYKSVIKYARNQKIFELTLKCAVRIYELDESERNRASSIISELSKTVILENRHNTWQTVVNSPYLAHFAETLKGLETPSDS